MAHKYFKLLLLVSLNNAGASNLGADSPDQCIDELELVTVGRLRILEQWKLLTIQILALISNFKPTNFNGA